MAGSIRPHPVTGPWSGVRKLPTTILPTPPSLSTTITSTSIPLAAVAATIRSTATICPPTSDPTACSTESATVPSATTQKVHNTAPKCGLGGPYDSGSNACGWCQEDSLPPPNASMGSVPRCGRCGRLDDVANICAAPLRYKGTCDLCGQFGHRWYHCVKNRSAPAPPHANVMTSPPHHRTCIVE